MKTKMSEHSRKIIRLLADGVDPITGEILPNTSLYNHPQVIRALFSILEEVDSTKKVSAKPKRHLPPKHGKPWTQEEKDYVGNSYKQGVPLKDIASHLQRTSGSIRSELIKQGHLALDDQPSAA